MSCKMGKTNIFMRSYRLSNLMNMHPKKLRMLLELEDILIMYLIYQWKVSSNNSNQMKFHIQIQSLQFHIHIQFLKLYILSSSFLEHMGSYEYVIFYVFKHFHAYLSSLCYISKILIKNLPIAGSRVTPMKF